MFLVATRPSQRQYVYIGFVYKTVIINFTMDVHLTNSETIAFLQEVEKYPCLQDTTYDNSTRQEKQKAWLKISEAMLLPRKLLCT